MINLRVIKFTSSTKGKKSWSFFDIFQSSGYNELTEHFYHGRLDKYFDEMVHARAERTWKGKSPDNPRQIRWELELIGDSCPTIDQGLLVCLLSFSRVSVLRAAVTKM